LSRGLPGGGLMAKPSEESRITPNTVQSATFPILQREQFSRCEEESSTIILRGFSRTPDPGTQQRENILEQGGDRNPRAGVPGTLQDREPRAREDNRGSPCSSRAQRDGAREDFRNGYGNEGPGTADVQG